MDFSILTDDQLLELIRLAVEEAVRRGAATATAAQDIGLDAAERLRMKQAAVAAEAARQQAQAEEAARQQAREEARRKAQAEEWRRKGELARPFVEELGSGLVLNVWARGADKRVYVERRAMKLCYYATGNHKFPPGTLDTEGVGHALKINSPQLEAIKERLRPAFEAAALWAPGLRFEMDQALKFVQKESA